MPPTSFINQIQDPINQSEIQENTPSLADNQNVLTLLEI